MKGYHSPQVDVAVRLNTNESPFAPPETWLSELTARAGPDRLQPLSGPTDPRAARRRSPATSGVAPNQVFCANGSNEVLQSLLLAYGGRGRTVAVFEPTYALHRHIAMLTATDVRTGWRAPDHSLDPAVVDERPIAEPRRSSRFSARRTIRPGRQSPKSLSLTCSRWRPDS